MHTVLMVVLLIASIALIASILMQSGKSDGLSGSRRTRDEQVRTG